jgi:hypothetical protein
MARRNPDNTRMLLGGAAVALLGWYFLRGGTPGAAPPARTPALAGPQLVALQQRVASDAGARLFALEAAYYTLGLTSRLPQGDPAQLGASQAAIAAVDQSLGIPASGASTDVTVLLQRVNQLVARTRAANALRPRPLPYALPQSTINRINQAAWAVVPGFFQLQVFTA